MFRRRIVAPKIRSNIQSLQNSASKLLNGTRAVSKQSYNLKNSEACSHLPFITQRKPLSTAMNLLNVSNRPSAVDPDSIAILQTLLHRQIQTQPRNSLACHDITPWQRSKIVDWMVDVFSSYELTDEGLMMAVNLLDSFWMQASTKQTNADLHLIGIACVFMASKYEEVQAIPLKIVEKKLAHQRYRTDEVLAKESEILLAVGFKMLFTTVRDFIGNIVNALKYGETTVTSKVRQASWRQFENKCFILSKIVISDYEFMNTHGHAVIALAIVSLNNTGKSKLKFDAKVRMIVEKLQLSQADVDQAVKDIKKNLQQSKYADLPSLSRLVNGYLKLTTGGFSQTTT